VFRRKRRRRRPEVTQTNATNSNSSRKDATHASLPSDERVLLLGPLFAGYDRGSYFLSDELLAARDAERRIAAALLQVNAKLALVDPAKERQEATKAVIDGAEKDGIPDDLEAPLLAAQESYRALSARQVILTDAREIAHDRTPQVASRFSDEIIAEGLRPAMDAVLANVREGAELGGSVPWGDARLLARADKAVRDYHEVAAQAADEYGSFGPRRSNSKS
jgi:hypothetical protein